MDIRDLHRRAVRSFADRVAAVRDDQWAAPSPCAGWTVRDLINHVVAGNRIVAPVLTGGTVDERYGGYLLGYDPRAAAREAGDEAAAVIEADGALDGMAHPPHGTFPGEVYAWQRFTENLIHGWDAAHATGGDEGLDPELVAACAGFLDQAEDLYRQAGFIGPRTEIGTDADPQAALLARFGRPVTARVATG
ncbi:MAG: TIGR03086 family protein [Pseudonocardiaceae bacterium]|nr:TIGR03086 family protein [Pseudonocardiaceae bacterium]